MAKRRKHKLLGISDKGWNTIGTGVKWWLIAGVVTTGAVLLIFGGVAVAGMASMSGAGLGASRQLPPVRIL